MVTTFEKYCSCDSDLCGCGETNEHEFVWDANSVERRDRKSIILSHCKKQATFHPGFSDGTIIVRGDKPFEANKLCYWEVKMMTTVYGTDVMVGVGTSKTQMTKEGTFCSLLGEDTESWGYSYRGYIQHAGESRGYAKIPFGQGSLVGVLVNTYNGTIQFFVNRKPLGLAFEGLQNKELYPMACSTAAQSVVRLTHSSSISESLQMRCYAALRPQERQQLDSLPGLRHLSQSLFSTIFTELHCIEKDCDNDLPEDSVILDDLDFALLLLTTQRKRYCRMARTRVHPYSQRPSSAASLDLPR